MAFNNGAPARVVTMVSDRMVRIAQESGNVESQFQLGAGATGTIGLHEKTVASNITLPAAFQPRPYERPGGEIVSLQDSVSVRVNYENGGTVLQPLSITKTGTTPEDFEISIANGGGATGKLEIYVEFH